MTVRMSVKARLNLEGIIRQQRSEDCEVLMTNYELLQKVRIPEPERAAYLREDAMGNATPIMTTIKAAPDTDVDLSSAEVRRVEGLLRDWKAYTVDDVEWLLALKTALKDAHISLLDTDRAVDDEAAMRPVAARKRG